ncbi:N-acetylmuramoyl-L-alanine amidase [Streptomyces sp. PKU-EA00015]|uniref:peptidoglycan recognition protein family protein n=1 Tax=Streptomyces sp. PKU-EA00015 TaxID=2748326 RepID=UPI0015A0861A|nr:N-acetylmuramoyl-L-alanine amidase [Streptomyces sp. PKU-EA00015]NWF25225.1 N-acetylmuramoyl-L-alanine amidase [Streptomyces sp. PKU-EA00015]
MATPLSADRLLKALRGEGLRVVEVRSWRTHNRNHKGAWGPVNGVMIHHTVTRGDTAKQTLASVELCYNGHSSLPGPLCHGVIAKDGTVYLVSAGRANHAGSGDDDVHQAVVNESATLPADNEANTDGNRHFYGFEAINLGDGKDPWPDAQLEAIEKAAAAICRAHGWSHRSVIGHLEWQPGKVDPRGFGMDWMRGRIKERLAPAPQPKPAPAPAPAPSEETDMPVNWSLATDTPQTVPAAKWTTIPISRTDLLTGATHYTASVHLTIEDPVPLGTVQGRFVHVRPDGSRWTGPIVERMTTGGASFMDFPHAGSVEPTEKVRFEVIYYPGNNDSPTPGPITAARVRGLYWK